MFDWKKFLHLKESDGVFDVFWSNGVFLGNFVKEVDGDYVFLIKSSSGVTGATYHRALADALDTLNHAWDIVTVDDLGEQPPLIPYLYN